MESAPSHPIPSHPWAQHTFPGGKMIRQAMSQVRENMTGMKWDTKGLWRPPSSFVRM